jgi:hypothetical protein
MKGSDGRWRCSRARARQAIADVARFESRPAASGFSARSGCLYIRPWGRVAQPPPDHTLNYGPIAEDGSVNVHIL